MKTAYLDGFTSHSVQRLQLRAVFTWHLYICIRDIEFSGYCDNDTLNIFIRPCEWGGLCCMKRNVHLECESFVQRVLNIAKLLNRILTIWNSHLPLSLKCDFQIPLYSTYEINLRNVQRFISCQPLECHSIIKAWNSTRVRQSQLELQRTCQSSDSSLTYMCVLNQNQRQRGLV